MIWKIWIRIIGIILCVTLPLLVAHYYLQKQSLNLASKMPDKIYSEEVLDSHLNLLKKLSKYEPHHRARYKEEFEKTVQAKHAKQDLEYIKDAIVSDLTKQTVRGAMVVLAVSIILSLLISRSIVRFFRQLLDQNRLQLRRLETLQSLESWQKLARILVHELRAPITPVKLIATDIESKQSQLRPAEFNEYLSQAAHLIREQVSIIERMLESFSLFAKLPEVNRVPTRLSSFLSDFQKAYEHYHAPYLTLTLEIRQISQETILLDPTLVKQVFFNLLKNACEANPLAPVLFEIVVTQDGIQTVFRCKNTGAIIPESISEKLFRVPVSTKAKQTNSNFGLGLSIAKKIALDHGGDLNLIQNSPNEGVVFELEIPNG